MGNPKDYRQYDCNWYNGKLTSLCDGDVLISYAYDGFGLRTSKTVGSDGTTINYTYDSNGNLIKEVGEKTIEYIYGADGIIDIKVNNASYLFRKNLFGDVTHIYSTSGTLVGKYSYTAFGECTIEKDSNNIASLNPIRYRSYYYDTETNYYYLKSRYYDPEIGRFISPDSIQYIDPETINGLNLYAYCGNNPVMRVDPNGNSWWSNFWNSVGSWFSRNWEKIVIGTAFIVVGAIVTALTAGTGVGFMAAFGSALLSSTIQVGISVGTSVLIGGVVSVVNGGGFFDNLGDNIANAYMWGGIFSGVAQILGGGFRIAANKGATTGRSGGIKLGNSGVKILSPDKNNWAKAGGTLIKVDNVFRIDAGAMWGLHMHILSSGHLPIGAIIAGLIGVKR